MLTKVRVNLVSAYLRGGKIVDVGIGCGDFVREYNALFGGATGYDVNPVGISWLKRRECWRDPYAAPVKHACFWDSLEHIYDPSVLLRNVQETVFVSIPIFTDIDHVRRSKHFRRDEHYWYFTSGGLLHYMKALGWRCVERTWMETDLGREDIETYVFKRVASL